MLRSSAIVGASRDTVVFFGLSSTAGLPAPARAPPAPVFFFIMMLQLDDCMATFQSITFGRISSASSKSAHNLAHWPAMLWQLLHAMLWRDTQIAWQRLQRARLLLQLAQISTASRMIAASCISIARHRATSSACLAVKLQIDKILAGLLLLQRLSWRWIGAALCDVCLNISILQLIQQQLCRLATDKASSAVVYSCQARQRDISAPIARLANICQSRLDDDRVGSRRDCEQLGCDGAQRLS
jgi:hypothetical protein